jgi:hypothetical protein
MLRSTKKNLLYIYICTHMYDTIFYLYRPHRIFTQQSKNTYSVFGVYVWTHEEKYSSSDFYILALFKKSTLLLGPCKSDRKIGPTII